MTSFISILAATDFSVDGNNAVRRAALLAHEHGARLHILHVLNPAGGKPLRDWFSPTLDLDLKAAQARDALRHLAVEISGAHDLTASVEVAVGNPFETLMKASEHVDLVVLGRRGRGHLKGLPRTQNRGSDAANLPTPCPRRQDVCARFLSSGPGADRLHGGVGRGDSCGRPDATRDEHACVPRPQLQARGRAARRRCARAPHHGDPPDGRRSDQRPHASQGRQTRPGQHVHELCTGVRASGALDPASRPQARCRSHRRRETGAFTVGQFPSRQRQQPCSVWGDLRHVDRAAASGQFSTTRCGNGRASTELGAPPGQRSPRPERGGASRGIDPGPLDPQQGALCIAEDVRRS